MANSELLKRAGLQTLPHALEVLGRRPDTFVSDASTQITPRAVNSFFFATTQLYLGPVSPIRDQKDLNEYAESINQGLGIDTDFRHASILGGSDAGNKLSVPAIFIDETTDPDRFVAVLMGGLPDIFTQAHTNRHRGYISIMPTSQLAEEMAAYTRGVVLKERQRDQLAEDNKYNASLDVEKFPVKQNFRMLLGRLGINTLPDYMRVNGNTAYVNSEHPSYGGPYGAGL